jgi:hypothetical protein
MAASVAATACLTCALGSGVALGAQAAAIRIEKITFIQKVRIFSFIKVIILALPVQLITNSPPI